MTVTIRHLLLDVLKPHAPSIIVLAERLADLAGVARVHITVLEVDARTETVKEALAGEAIDFEAVRNTIETVGATVHSIDRVSASRQPDVTQTTARPPA